VSDWKITLDSSGPYSALAIVDVLTAQWAWQRLSKPARAAVEAAYPDRPIRAHHQTRDALTRHGFTAWDNAAQDWLLTEAGKAVAKWCVKP
jgi:hypothetical protein